MAPVPSSNLRISVVAETYAKALFNLTEQAGVSEQVRDELRELAVIVSDTPQLEQLFAHRTVDLDRRAASIRKMFGDQVHEVLLKFLLVLNQRRRLDQLPGVAYGFDKRLKERRGEVDVQVITARPLDEQHLNAVRDQISKMIGKTAIVEPVTDASLIGGLKIRIGDQVIDASVSRQLRAISHRLLEQSHEVSRRGEALRA